jgi:hypothetical protein
LGPIGFFVTGERGIYFDKYQQTDSKYYSCLSNTLALCLHEHKNERIAPIMFPPFSLDPHRLWCGWADGAFFCSFSFFIAQQGITVMMAIIGRRNAQCQMCNAQ